MAGMMWPTTRHMIHVKAPVVLIDKGLKRHRPIDRTIDFGGWNAVIASHNPELWELLSAVGVRLTHPGSSLLATLLRRAAM